MPWYLNPEVWNAALAVVAIGLSLYAIVEGRRTSRRTGVIELHGAWIGVNELDPHQLIGMDVAAAVQALNVTAAVWNHDVIDKGILHESYWDDYKHLFDVLAASEEVVPGYKHPGKEFLNMGIRKAYQGMKRWERRHADSRRRFWRISRMEDEMTMQPIKQPNPDRQPTPATEMERIIDAIRIGAERARAIADAQPDLKARLRDRTLQDILPILLGPAGERCPACGGSGRR